MIEQCQEIKNSHVFQSSCDAVLDNLAPPSHFPQRLMPPASFGLSPSWVAQKNLTTGLLLLFERLSGEFTVVSTILSQETSRESVNNLFDPRNMQTQHF